MCHLSQSLSWICAARKSLCCVLHKLVQLVWFGSDITSSWFPISWNHIRVHREELGASWPFPFPVKWAWFSCCGYRRWPSNGDVVIPLVYLLQRDSHLGYVLHVLLVPKSVTMVPLQQHLEHSSVLGQLHRGRQGQPARVFCFTKSGILWVSPKIIYGLHFGKLGENDKFSLCENDKFLDNFGHVWFLFQRRIKLKKCKSSAMVVRFFYLFTFLLSWYLSRRLGLVFPYDQHDMVTTNNIYIDYSVFVLFLGQVSPVVLIIWDH